MLSYYLLWRTGALSEGHPLAWSGTDLSLSRQVPGVRPQPTSAVAPPAAALPPTELAFRVTAPPPERLAFIPPPSSSDLERLRQRALRMPIDGLRASDLKDTFEEGRGGSRRHEALDILAPRGTPVLAVDEGRLVKLFTSRQGGFTAYQFDRDEEYCYYYAHLDRYAEGLQEGQLLHRGDRIGYVGTSGNASPDTPHLHFAVFKLGPEKRWWHGRPINPYAVLSAGSDEASRPSSAN